MGVPGLLAMALLLRQGALAARRGVAKNGAGPACVETRRVSVTGTASDTFGVGGEDNPYADGTDICWVLQSADPDATHTTLAFQLLHTEFNHDYVTIYSGSGASATQVRLFTRPAIRGRPAVTDRAQVGAKFSGEMVQPFVTLVLAATVTIHFQADSLFRSSEARTMQLGFVAVAVDSSGGACYNDCGGARGECVSGLCVCAEGWGADSYTDCSVAVARIEDSVELQIEGLQIGDWTYFKFELSEAASFLVELLDSSDAGADPRLMLSTDTLPTLSHYAYNDWFNWFYDCSDIHYIRGSFNAGTYYIGVTNDRFRAEAGAPLNAAITVRLDVPGSLRCLLDCNGHGTCDHRTGNCACDAGWEGSVVNAPDTCQFEILPMALDTPYTSAVRIGNWDYYAIEIAEELAFKRSLIVEFVSKSPRAFPLAVLRHGDVPRLSEGLLPTLDAFVYDVADAAGFNLLKGQRYSILVNTTTLSAGTWYVGVYNIWGHNGAQDYNSHATADYDVRASLYSAGKPCPSSGLDQFCSGYQCDFNTGECQCPASRLWRDCSFETIQLPTDDTAVNGPMLNVEETQYYNIPVSDTDIEMGENLLITVDVTSMDGATPLLLARFGGVPFPGDLSAYDEHDLLSNFYGDRRHEILIDAEELAAAGEGSWYVAVTNGEASAAALTFTITATKAQRVDCPLAHGNGGECSTAGECVSQLGRCDCNAGRVLDDCSADGVFELDVHKSPSTTDSTTPDIAVDGWAYWSVIVGCGHRFLGITFTSSDEGTAPLLVVRRGRLPLMVTGTYDYWDYYTGENKHEKVQRVAVTDCEDPVVGCASGCCITPLYPGTAFATGAPEAGVYYIGVYNDAKLATKPLKSYKLDVIVRAAAAAAPCGAPCAEGFVGGSCDVACPGRMPADVYSNSPVDDGAVCSAVGSCYIDRADATASICDCGALFTGGNCEFACPAVAGKAEPCAGHGSCVAPAAAGGAAECACDYGFGGGDCAVTCGGCGGRGACDFDTLECACDDGFVGKDCEFECPFANGKTCADAGECVVRHSYTGVEKVECVCEALAHGDACNLRCPVSQLAEFASRECSGAGACDFSGNSASCTCFTGSAGAACDVNTTLLRPGGSSKKSSSGGLGVGASAALACVALVLFAAMAGAACVAEKRRREVRRYERLVREVGSSASTIITANGARHRDDGEYTAPDDVSPTFDAIELPQFNDLRDVKKAVSPFHDEAIEL